MNLSAPFIKRPIGTSLLALGLAMAGLLAFNALPVAPLPEVDFPTISVNTSLPGASPEIVATSIATPLERQLGKIASVTQMTSSSTLGNTNIVLQFDLSRNIDGAARDVQAALNAASTNLPSNLPFRPTYRKINPADAPILIMALTSKKYTTDKLYDFASTILQQRLQQVSGVGQVIVGGGSLPAVRVELNPMQLNSYGIGLDDVSSAIDNSNVTQAKGQLIMGDRISNITANDQLFNAKAYRALIIRYQNNRAVRLQDVANVVDSVQDVRNAGILNGQPAVILLMFKQPGANIVATVDAIRQLMPVLKNSIPKEVNITTTLDRSQTIRASLRDVEITLLIAIMLVILVSYLYLGNVRAMLIPAVAVPLSILGTFCVMFLLGYTLDNLSLMALIISTGFVVDDAVVVLENISRHLELGKNPHEAALKGTQEVGFTVLSMSLSLIAVFIPILLMGGIIGRIFREFAVTLASAIIISMLISLTLTPSLCAQFLKTTSHRVTFFEKYFNIVKSKYEKSLNWVLAHDWLMFLVTLLTIMLTLFLYMTVPKGFFPIQDTGRIIGSLQADQNSSFQIMKKKLISYIKIIQKAEGVENVAGYVGGSTTNSGFILVNLKPLAQRHFSANQIANQLRARVRNIPGAELFLTPAQDLTIGGRQSNAQFQYTLSANNLGQLNAWAPKVMNELKKIPGIADVNSDQRSHGLQAFVTIDRNTASRLNISPQLIDNTLYNAFGQNQISTMYTSLNQYRVVMEVAPQYLQYPDMLDQMYVKSVDGNIVPLSAIAKFERSNTLLSVNHQGVTPAATLSFNLLPNVALGDAVKNVADKVDALQLPASIQGSFQGMAQAFQSSLASEPYLILTALLAVYIVLGILYESLIHPITILSTLPSAGVGALLALLMTHSDLNIIALIGIILLIGIVKKNAIMMIDFALQAEHSENKSSLGSIQQAAVMRFRPIMMTTTAAIFGALPLVLAYGLGSELRQPLGITIVGGLLVSQVLTLYTTPVIYLSFEYMKNWLTTKVRGVQTDSG